MKKLLSMLQIQYPCVPITDLWQSEALRCCAGPLPTALLLNRASARSRYAKHC